MPTKRKHSPDPQNSSSDEENNRGYESDEEGGVRIDDIYIPPPPRPPGTIEVSGQRIIITKIINTNFKSYGEVQLLGPFHKNFNAIVGPNGSGKSNVIDSLLFVFGYRASKIRSKKLSVLLHKSEKYPHVHSCTVSVHFNAIKDKEEDFNAFEEVPNSEIVVSRTVNKDNSSYYTLNDLKVQYKEIAACLRKHGIDLDHNRFLILQGEVEQISLMKPKAQTEHDTGMLEYLEDIIGTTRFKEPLNKIDEKIEILSELRTEKLNRVKLAEREKNDLVEPMQEAVKFLELENTVSTKKNFLYQRQVKHLKEKILNDEEKKVGLAENEKEAKERLDKLVQEKKTRETKYKEQTSKYENLHKKKDEFKEAFDRASNRDVAIQAELAETNKRRRKVIEILKEEKLKLEDLDKIPQRSQQNIIDYEAREKKLTSEKENLETEKNQLLVSLREETLVLQEKKERIQTKLVDERKVVDEAKSAFSIAESELKLFVSSEDNERRKLEGLKQSFEENKEKLTERSKQLKEIKQRLPVVEKAHKDALANLDRAKIEEAKIINDIKVQRVQLEETRSSQQASKSRGRVLDSLNQQKVEGNLPGLFGRLGDLGAINQKYDIAMSTACGPLDNIVVDSVDTAQWCIEFLKAHNIGRGTFIALDKQEYLRGQYSANIKIPENVPRLFDLIKVEDDRVRPAFYYALRDTLVANDIDQATRIAYGARRFRVVTLKGDLIETSGTMSGGGRSVLKGRMGQSVAVQSKIASPRKVNDMEGSLAKLEQQARSLHEKQTTLEDRVSTLQVEVRQLKTDSEKFSIEVQSLQQQQPNLTTQLKRQEQKVKESCANPAQVKKLENTVQTKKLEYEKANSKSVVFQKEVDSINKDIKDKTDKKMRGVNKKLNECTEVLEKCKAEIIKQKVAIKTAERNSKKCKDKMENLETEKTETETKLRAMSAERKQIEIDGAKLLEIIKKLVSEINEGEKEFSEEREQIEELSQLVNKLKSEKIELDQKLNEINRNVKDSKDLLSRIESKLSSLALQEIPEQTKEPLRKFTDEELENTDTKYMEIELKREEEELKTARPNLTAINEYRKKQLHYLDRVKEVEEVTSKRIQMKELREDLRKKRQKEFHAGFNLISQKLKEMYQLITLGGDAELEMVDSYDPFAEGIILNVRPPKKSWKNITNLSGGEKTLSSLALVFALHYYKPSPLYFMDEIDAALDFKNVSIVGNYIKERTKNAQFIIISLRSNMFELADHLIGIYKTYNITKSLTISPGLYDPKISNVNLQSQVTTSRPTQPTGNEISDEASLYDNSASEYANVNPVSQQLFSQQNNIANNPQVNGIPESQELFSLQSNNANTPQVKRIPESQELFSQQSSNASTPVVNGLPTSQELFSGQSNDDVNRQEEMEIA